MSAAAARRAKVIHAKNGTTKSKAASARPDKNGLWVNWDFLRNLSKRAPGVIMGEETSTQYSRYLKLADIAFGQTGRYEGQRKLASSMTFQQTPQTTGGMSGSEINS